MRTKVYTFYGLGRGGPFSVKTRAYDFGYQWIYEVRAASIKQAYYLATAEIFAAGPHAVGVRRIEYAWWHGGCELCHRTQGCPAHRITAPYLEAA